MRFPLTVVSCEVRFGLAEHFETGAVEDSYLGVLISAGLSALVVAIMVGASRILGRRHPTRAKLADLGLDWLAGQGVAAR